MTAEMIQNNEHATRLAIRIARRLMLVDECIAENDIQEAEAYKKDIERYVQQLKEMGCR